MIDESKIIFFTGAPGSKWSAISHLLTKNTYNPINTSDYNNTSRYYLHKKYATAHQGAYWGPGFELGKNFHRIDKISKQEVFDEIDAAYTDKSWDKYRIVKCHQFALNLDYIKETFPLSKIAIVFRPWLQCEQGWVDAAGGFDTITYPNYTPYYKDIPTIKQKIFEEVNAAGSFIQRNIKNLEFDLVHEKYWKSRWGIERNTEDIDNYMKSVESRTIHHKTSYNFDISLALYNFER